MSHLLDFKKSDTVELLQIAIEQIQDWLVITDRSGIILYINREVEKLSGYTKEEVVGKKPSIWKSDEHPKEVYTKLWDEIVSGKTYYGVIANRHKNGNKFFLANTISPVKDDHGNICYFVSTAKDITENYELEKQLHDIMHYDGLTRLLNRHSFMELMQEEMSNRHSRFAIATIGMNNLNLINNTYGFVCGDQVIKEVGRRIESVVNEENITARIQGETFAVLLSQFKNASKIVKLIKKIEETTKEPIIIENKEIYITVTTGIAIYPNDATDPNELLTRAQIALSNAQNSNQLSNYAFYTPQMNEEVQKQLYLQGEIYKAYENDEFIPYFQPFIDIKTRKICGLEALMRRKKPSGEIVLPGEFIDLLEQTGLIEKVGLQLIRKICIQLRQWIDQNIPVVPVAINISPLQFRDKNFAKEIMRIINDTGIPCKLITLEITESMLMEDMALAKSMINELRRQGCMIAIDDFGTGYSSLGYLKEFNADHIKIDISFIRDIVTNVGDQAIVKAIVMIAKALQMETIAEGIETQEQLEIITNLDCDMGQGRYWDYPLPAEEIEGVYLLRSKV